MRLLIALCLMLPSWHAHASETLRVAVVGDAPPMSYTGADGQLTGFNVELARALCETLERSCEFKSMPLGEVIGQVAARQVDFAVVSLLATPERRARVLFTQPLYKALSVWLSAQPFSPTAAPGPVIAVVQGSVQHRYGEARGWTLKVLDTHAQVYEAVAQGSVQAALLPMTSGINVIRDSRFGATGWSYTLIGDPALAGEVAISVAPGQTVLLGQLNAAIDRLRRNGRFDRINTQFLPFRLQ